MVSAYRCSLTRGRVKLCQKSVSWASRENDAKRLMGKSSSHPREKIKIKRKRKKEKGKKNKICTSQ